MPAAAVSQKAAAFIAKWRKASGSERANYQLFITELCDLLGVDKPDPSSEDTHDDGHHQHAHDLLPAGAHSHWHRPDPVTHVHPHMPDAHHAHRH